MVVIHHAKSKYAFSMCNRYSVSKNGISSTLSLLSDEDLDRKGSYLNRQIHEIDTRCFQQRGMVHRWLKSLSGFV